MSRKINNPLDNLRQIIKQEVEKTLEEYKKEQQEEQEAIENQIAKLEALVDTLDQESLDNRDRIGELEDLNNQCN